MKRSNFMQLIFIILVAAFPLRAQNLVINEIMTANTETLADEDGEYHDWIEIYSAHGIPLNLNGFGLSDDPDDPLKWQFGEMILNPDNHLMLFASGKDRQVIANHVETVIQQGDVWKYRLGESEPPEDWNTINFDDQSWQSGPSGFGYGDDDDSTRIPPVISICIRKTFNIDNLNNIVYVLLHMDYDDGFVAYLNGREVARANIGTPGVPPSYDETAVLNHEAVIYDGLPPDLFIMEDFDTFLRSGNNVLAVQAHNSDSASSDMSIIPFLTLGMSTTPPNPRGVPDILLPVLLPIHTNFRLRATGEPLILSNASGLRLDRIASIPLPANISYGRQPDGASDWFYFSEPTPGLPNITTGGEGFSEKPRFLPPGGFYSGSAEVTLNSSVINAVIHYTLDGSDPTEESEIYNAPLQINSTTVIRATSAEPRRLPSPIETQTYILNYTTSLPVVSLSTNPPNLWDAERGIYVLGNSYDPDPPHRGANYFEDWERPVNVNFFEPNGTLGFSLDGGVKIHGGYTRSFPQKSLAIFARARYGDPEIEYQIFPDLPFDRFESFILRNGGSDWNHTMFRDPLFLSLVDDIGFDAQAYRPSVVFINGAYWGIHNLREKRNEHFVASHHDVDPDNIDWLNIWGGVIHGDNQHFNSMMDFVSNHDLSDSANYEYVRTLMEIENFIDFNITNIYIDNTDWPANNNEFWRPKRPDGRWRWFLYDTDFGFGLHDSAAYLHNTLEFALNDEGDNWPNPAFATLLLRKLLENRSFKNDFINRFDDLFNFNFQPTRIIDKINQIKNLILGEIPRHLERWDRLLRYWNRDIDELYFFAEHRNEYMRAFILEEFDLPGLASVEVNLNYINRGTIKVNTKFPEQFPYEGQYFKGVPINLTAIPYDGFRFIRWEGSLISYVRMLSVELSGPIELNAVFEAIEFDSGGIVINEINYQSEDNFDVGDWVELFAAEGNHDLTGFTLRDNSNASEYRFADGIILNEGEYLIVARDSASFTQLFRNVTNVTGSMNFRLNAGGDMIRLYNANGFMIDSVAYDDELPWPVEPDTTGRTLELVNPYLHNETPVNWRASLLPYGSPGFSNQYSAPDSFSLLMPEDDAVLEDDSVMVRWETSGSSTEEYISYLVQWSLRSDFSVGSEYSANDTFFVIGDLPSDTTVLASMARTDALPDSVTIYWRVKAVTDLGVETYSMASDSGWSFHIQFPVVEPPEMPDEFSIGFSYPNPFNNRFKIPIALVEDGTVNIKIYNLIGKNLFKKRLALKAGYHDFMFSDETSGIDLPAGVYILKVTHGDDSHLQTIVLLK